MALKIIGNLQEKIVADYQNNQNQKLIWKTGPGLGKTRTILNLALTSIEKTNTDFDIWLLSNNQKSTNLLYQKLSYLLRDRYHENPNPNLTVRNNQNSRIELIKNLSDENKVAVTISNPLKRVTLPETRLLTPNLILIDNIDLTGTYQINQFLNVLENTPDYQSSNYQFFATMTNILESEIEISLRTTIPNTQILTTELKSI